MNQGVTQYAIWIVATLFQLLVLIALLRRNLQREFSLFFWYTVAHFADSVISYFASLIGGWTYFYVYWGWEVIDAIFTLIVIQSVFIKIFDSYSSIRNLGMTVFRWATIGFCCFALVYALFAPGSEDPPLMKGALVMESSIQLVQVGLLLSLLLFSKVFGLAWRHYIYGIILGFGVSATISLVAATLRTMLGPDFHHYWSWAFSGAYTFGLATWLFYFVSKSTVAVSAKTPSSAQLSEWNEALTGILRR